MFTTNLLLTLLFLAVTLGVFYVVPASRRWMVLLTASVIFYASAHPYLLWLVVATVTWTWFVGLKLTAASQGASRKSWLVAGILPIVLVLGVFKYFNFFSTSIAELLNQFGLAADPLTLQLVLPLGLSYYSFKLISYLVDLYRTKREAECHLGYFATYTLYFPQILCGPIERSTTFLSQLHAGPVFDQTRFAIGIQRIILGLFKKVVIANSLILYVDKVFAAPQQFPGLALWTAAFLYSVRIYCDFSGYSDIAVGMSQMFGLDCPNNFNCPYLARNNRDFWNRWHISLSTWLRDYIYIPLGGNRVGAWRHRLNILITFFVSGLWHGANWTFVCWGLIHGVWNMLTPKTKRATTNTPASNQTTQPATTTRRFTSTLVLICQTLLTFAGVTAAWIFFRSPSLGAACDYFARMFTAFSLTPQALALAILPFTGDNTCLIHFLASMGFILFLFIYECRQTYARHSIQNDDKPVLSMPVFTMMLVAILMFGAFGQSSFMYANY